jgi:hypothetical protein
VYGSGGSCFASP